jgi:tetraprenyl-beta-curcumene synthase
VAAGASSSVAAHALIAAAANPKTAPEQAALIDGAYFPAIGALTVLLDDLIDREEDRAGGEHNYMPYYESATEAAKRIGLLGARARAAIARLQGARRHRAILAGIAAFYMSELKPADQYAVPIRERLLQALGPNPRLIMAALKARKLNWLPSQFSR